VGEQMLHEMRKFQQGKFVKKGKPWVVWLVMAICMTPVVASYWMYYFFKPSGGVTNYGVLIDPQLPIPSHDALQVFKGRWIMLAVEPFQAPIREVRKGPFQRPSNNLDKACVEKLYAMRQIRAALGKERHRLITVLLRTRQIPLDALILRAYPDIHFIDAAKSADSIKWLPTEAQTTSSDHLYLIDPQGHLMMRFPQAFDPSRIEHDVSKLLKWSRSG
jgi:hypothetical protein